MASPLPYDVLERALKRTTLKMEAMALIRLVAAHLPRGELLDVRMPTGMGHAGRAAGDTRGVSPIERSTR